MRFMMAGSTCKRLWPGGGEAGMLKMRVIPCLDVKDGRVVKGVKFVDLRRCRRSGGAGEAL